MALDTSMMLIGDRIVLRVVTDLFSNYFSSAECTLFWAPWAPLPAVSPSPPDLLPGASLCLCVSPSCPLRSLIIGFRAHLNLVWLHCNLTNYMWVDFVST